MSLLKDITNFVDKQLGNNLPSPIDKKGNKEPQLPWSKGDQPTKFFGSENEVFFTPFTIDPDRWNQFYPYRLVVVDVANQNKIVTGEGVTTSNTAFNVLQSEGGIEYVISQEALPNAWAMVLPITPQQLQITDQFAINTSATMRGIVEEHNGVKFKMITASGTTGIWPLRPTVGGNIKRKTTLGSIFGGTLQNFSNLAQQVSATIKSAATGEHPNNPEAAKLPGETSVGSKASTGYYQALYLGQFLERYAQAKKHPEWKNMRLVLDMPKQNQSFVVTPVQFSLNQTEQRPGEYLFTIQLKAWKRIKLNEFDIPAASGLPDLGDPNTYQKIVSTIEQTRRALGASINLVKAVRSDWQGIFNNLRQVSLIVKDISGLAFSIADLPRQFKKDLRSAIEDSAANLLDAFTVPGDRFRDRPVQGWVKKSLDSGDLTSLSSKAGVIAQSIANKKRTNEGLSSQAVKNGALGLEASQREDSDILNKVFDNPEENFEFFNTIPLDEVNLSPEQQESFENELEVARLLTINDLRDIKADLFDLSNQISDNYGSGDPTFSSIYGLPEPRERAVSLSIEENEIMIEIFEAMQALDTLTSTKQFDDLNTEDPLAFVGGLADESGVDFENFTSKILAPVPFGLTIEEIAARYMGDSNKWLEIVTLNKLRSPYIDEDGFVYNLLSNASGRQMNVDDTSAQLFIGQKIILLSDTVPAFTRKITNVEKIGDNNYLVTVDGLDNLDNLTTADNARLQGYLPGTVNSQNQIYIPVNLPSEEDDRTFEIPDFSDNRLAKISKVDFLLTDEFDIAINSIGDFRLATGLNNLIQALKLKIRTKKGSLLRHLNYGLGLEHGISVADVQSGAIIEELNKMIGEDSRFQSITKINLTLKGSTLGIDMVVQLANGTGVLPINFDLRVA